MAELALDRLQRDALAAITTAWARRSWCGAKRRRSPPSTPVRALPIPRSGMVWGDSWSGKICLWARTSEWGISAENGGRLVFRGRRARGLGARRPPPPGVLVRGPSEPGARRRGYSGPPRGRRSVRRPRLHADAIGDRLRACSPLRNALQITPKARLSATAPACRAIVATRLAAPPLEDAALRALQFAQFTTTGRRAPDRAAVPRARLRRGA